MRDVDTRRPSGVGSEEDQMETEMLSVSQVEFVQANEQLVVVLRLK